MAQPSGRAKAQSWLRGILAFAAAKMIENHFMLMRPPCSTNPEAAERLSAQQKIGRMSWTSIVAV
jgi:hypothetical protein